MTLAGSFLVDLTVDAGQVVAFVNGHDDEHTATVSGFDTGIIQPGSVATVTLATPGRFAYACQIHPEMTGSIAVRDASGAIPEAQPAATPSGGQSVSIANLAFSPAQLSVAPGTTVVWTNDDAVPHPVTAVDGTFDSGIFDPGANVSWTFDSPGEFAYLCQLHPQMQGVVTVTADATGTAPAEGAAGTPTSVPASDPVGTWLVDLAPSDGLLSGELRGLLQLRPDGTLGADLVLGPEVTDTALRPEAGSGTWTPTAGRLRFTIVVMMTDADRYVGLLWIDASTTFDPANNALSGTFHYALTDAAEEPVGAGNGEIVAQPVVPAQEPAARAAISG